MAQPVETATDHRHTHKYLGLIMVNVYIHRYIYTDKHGRYQTYFLPSFAVDKSP